jgi:transketolase C-terminal domain/subunit
MAESSIQQGIMEFAPAILAAGLGASGPLDAEILAAHRAAAYPSERQWEDLLNALKASRPHPADRRSHGLG